MIEILSRVVVPVVNDDDAHVTYRRLREYLPDDSQIYAVNVLEKSGGGIDKAGVEQREEVAEEAFETIRTSAAADGLDVETEIRYGTDVAEAIQQAAVEHDATAIAFASRGGGRLMDLLSGSVRSKLVTDSDRPVVILPKEPDE